jgi:predicted DNA-binding protein (MmcQ/YjbR family)
MAPSFLTPDAFEAAALALPGATLSIQWGHWRIYKVGGKAFAWMSGDATPTVAFKVDDMAFELLTRCEGIRPSRYRARYNFIELESLAAMEEAELRGRLAVAHRLVAETLPRRSRPSVR